MAEWEEGQLQIRTRTRTYIGRRLNRRPEEIHLPGQTKVGNAYIACWHGPLTGWCPPAGLEPDIIAALRAYKTARSAYVPVNTAVLQV